MYALTLRQPWSWAVAHAGKRIENRSWKPPQRIISAQVAIHAGKRVDAEAAQLLGFEFETPAAFVSGAVETVATVTGWTAAIDESGAQAPWFLGPIGWVLDEVVVLGEPVVCRGAQGLWVLSGDDEAAVRVQLNQPRHRDKSQSS